MCKHIPTQATFTVYAWDNPIGDAIVSDYCDLHTRNWINFKKTPPFLFENYNSLKLKL
jgi:hypothetical protein